MDLPHTSTRSDQQCDSQHERGSVQQTPNATLAIARIELNHWLQGCARTTVDGPKQHTFNSLQHAARISILAPESQAGRDSTAGDTVSGGMLRDMT